MITSFEDDCEWFDVDRFTTAISRARLVMKFQDVLVDVLDPIAIHKYADMTKDFHTFFDEKSSGLYRCFGMVYNLPVGYTKGDCDFYVDVYTTSQYYKCLEALDIRTGRKFIKVMRGGVWKEWVETGGTGQTSLVPVSIYKHPDIYKGENVMLSLSDLGITDKDTLIVSFGHVGIGVRVDPNDDYSMWEARYYIEPQENLLTYYVKDDDPKPCHIEIFKYVPNVVEPPKPWTPYLKLRDVLTEFKHDTPMGARFYLDIGVTSWELVRMPFVVLTFPDGEIRLELNFDGKDKYYFTLPFNAEGKFKEGDVVVYHLVWDDQLEGQHIGNETVTKDIIFS
jgi:hypothetical protein